MASLGAALVPCALDLFEEGAHDVAAGRPAGIEVDRRDDGFERVGENRVAAKAAALELAGSEVQQIAELGITRDRRQRAAVDERGAKAGHLAFVGAWMLLEDQLGDDQVDQRIAEELEPFVVVMARAAMRQRLREQRGGRERVSKRAGCVTRHRHCAG